MADERNDEDRTPVQDDLVLAIESGPLTEVDVVETDDGSHVDVAINAVSVDPDTGDVVPVSIALNVDDSAYVVTIAGDEFVVPLEETAEESSHRQSALIRPLRTLQQLAQRVEEETAGAARRLAEKFKRRGQR
ncbi:hypothetical protein P5G50_17980 [Leifsonia sp. F6_8S_P_1B]|uniref:Uncharacterized protein n=1 Tax=Leifsonia williamsii TaxID=3035919 RepID=A0ABT8KH67_9MICO|nr:hypothetical protein [Leifsonia williamsii]MDN4616342.1 hypothetical protein [Leifsonia williamsii]